MRFCLNLKLADSRLTCESKAILCLIDYCELKLNDEFDLNLYSNESASFVVDDELSQFRFHRPDQKLKCKRFSEITDDYVTDTNLPSLVRRINEADDCFITITGLASVFRDIIKITNNLRPSFQLQSLLGYRNNCLKACSEVSKWTYLCEITSVKVYNNVENDLLRNEFLVEIENTLKTPLNLANRSRKSNKERSKEMSQDGNHRYLEDYFVCVSDLILFHFITNLVLKCEQVKLELERKYKEICVWYLRMQSDENINKSFGSKNANLIKFSLDKFQKDDLVDKLNELTLSEKPSEVKEPGLNDDIELLFNDLVEFIFKKYDTKVPIDINQSNSYTYEDISFDWSTVDPLVSPLGGSLPSKRVNRKCHQLENFLHIFKNQIYPKYQSKKEKNSKIIVVDFCSGGGHLGIFLAFMFPDCLFKLVENKEESLEFAIERISKLKLKNCLVYKGNLTNFIGKFSIGLGVHTCGALADLIIEKCVQSKADVLIAPCCYGSIKENDLIKYPRSLAYSEYLNENNVKDFYSKLSNYADRTEKNLVYEHNAYLSMSFIDTDRLLYTKQNGYSFIQLSKMQPEDCTTKNNLLLALF